MKTVAGTSGQKPQCFIDAPLENIEDAIVACDAAGALTVFNHAARELHGLAELPVTADSWTDYYDLYQPDGRTRMRREETPLYRALRGERVRDAEMVVVPKGAARRAPCSPAAAPSTAPAARSWRGRRDARHHRAQGGRGGAAELAREQAARAEAEARQPAEGRVPRDALARAADAARRDPRLGPAARRRADRRTASARARSRSSSATRAPGAAHRGPARRLAHRRRQAAARRRSRSTSRAVVEAARRRRSAPRRRPRASRST